jgi:hypothetical protein
MAKKWGGSKAMAARQRLAASLPAACYRCSTVGRHHYVMPGDKWDVDHMDAHSQGGSDSMANLAPSCAASNRRHGQQLSTARINATKKTRRDLPNL